LLKDIEKIVRMCIMDSNKRMLWGRNYQRIARAAFLGKQGEIVKRRIYDERKEQQEVDTFFPVGSAGVRAGIYACPVKPSGDAGGGG
jgi:hypothetical protein